MPRYRTKKEQQLESIERAIRNAFAKADAHNPAVRQRIYESAWGVHERALVANSRLDDRQKESRRDKLKQVITKIEAEAAQPHKQTRQQAEPQFDISADDGFGSTGRSNVAAEQDDQRLKKHRQRDSDLDFEVQALNKTAPKKKRSLWFRYGLPALVLVSAIIIGFSLYNSFADLNRVPASGQTALSNSSAPLKEREAAENAMWISIFKPSDATRLSVQGRATAQISGEGGVSFVRVKSAGADDAVIFDVGEGILNQFAGKTATFDIVARSDEGKPTQMSVMCDFAGMGECGRRRYDVADAQDDFLFDVTFPQGKKAGGNGTITINSDLSNGGLSVDIFAIRVKIAQK